tara:strand:- start:197 stop:328 length:132 start_codon:yes stop_codon:yes gene_type:complete
MMSPVAIELIRITGALFLYKAIIFDEIYLIGIKLIIAFLSASY